MTNELRIKIAESLGWKWSKTITHECVIPVLLHGEDVYVNMLLPDLSDANAALQLVEVLEKDGWFPQIKLALNHSKNKWGCAFSAYGKPQHFATAPTLPEAICLAYCAVKSIQTDK